MNKEKVYQLNLGLEPENIDLLVDRVSLVGSSLPDDVRIRDLYFWKPEHNPNANKDWNLLIRSLDKSRKASVTAAIGRAYRAMRYASIGSEEPSLADLRKLNEDELVMDGVPRKSASTVMKILKRS